MIVFACGGCGAQYSIESRLAGRTARCRNCGAEMQIPLPASPAAPVIEAQPRPAMDWDALGLPAAAPAGHALGGGHVLRRRPAKRRSSGSGMLWLALGGGGAVALLLMVGAVVAIVQLAGGGSLRAEAAAYLPADWTMAISIRPAALANQAARFSKAKPYIDKALAEATTSQIDVHEVSEVLITTVGNDQYLVAIFDGAIEPDQLLGGSAPSDNYQGMDIYRLLKPGRADTIYVTSPQPRLLVGANQLDRLKDMLDQAASGRPGAADLPSGDHFVLSVRNLSALGRSPLPTPVPLSDVRGLTFSAHLSSDLNLNAVVELKDAQTAASLEQKMTQALEAQRKRRQQMAQRLGTDVVSYASDRLRIYATGSRLRITASIPMAKLFDNLPPPDAFKSMAGMRSPTAPPSTRPRGTPR